MGTMDPAIELLKEVLNEAGMRDAGDINVCELCQGAWVHYPDCLWLKIHAFLREQGVPLDPVDPSEVRRSQTLSGGSVSYPRHTQCPATPGTPPLKVSSH
jgi:hypothetical protein